MTTPIERWVPIAGTDGWYEVSDLGRVRSWKNNKWGRRAKPKVLKAAAGKGPKQYLGVNIDRGSGYHTAKLHTLVAEAFIGPRPDGLHICHGDGNPFNNAASNLRYEVPRENEADKVAHGTLPRGSKHHASKLTPEGVREIRVALQAGGTIRGVAAQFGVSSAAVGDIKSGRTWAHLN